MKRLIIEGDWRLEGTIWKPYAGMVLLANVREQEVTSIEDVPEPLPTEPGARFWGKAQDHPAEWWFVADSRATDNSTRYVSSSCYFWDAEQVARNGLVRLPDPEATS